MAEEGNPPLEDKETIVPIGKIGAVPLPYVPEEPATPNENPMTGQPDFRHELGWVGKFVGGRAEKAGNVAFMVIAAAFFLLVILMIGWIIHDGSKGEYAPATIVSNLVGLIGTAAGFMFGKSSGKRDD